MRYQGKLAEWNDDRGFGFIVRNDGGAKAFVHIKSFESRRRRPVEGDIVSYDVRLDATARPQAERVAFVALRRRSAGSRRLDFSIAIAAAFLLFIAAATVVGTLPVGVFALYLAASAAAFAAYSLDKSAATRGRRRTPENTLHMLAIAGGWPGALVAQSLLRHKTSKASFRSLFWVTVAVNCILLGALLSPVGGDLRAALAGG